MVFLCRFVHCGGHVCMGAKIEEWQDPREHASTGESRIDLNGNKIKDDIDFHMCRSGIRN